MYKWSGSRFEVFHRLPTVERAYGVKALAVDGTQFLAVARWKAESSLVFRWNGTEFELFQEVPSKRVRYSIHHLLPSKRKSRKMMLQGFAHKITALLLKMFSKHSNGKLSFKLAVWDLAFQKKGVLSLN